MYILLPRQCHANLTQPTRQREIHAFGITRLKDVGIFLYVFMSVVKVFVGKYQSPSKTHYTADKLHIQLFLCMLGSTLFVRIF